MLKIVTVLKSGGQYTEKNVEILHNNIKKFVSFPHKFVCLTDLDTGNYEKVKLEKNYPAWWSKMELFKIEGPVLYLDLDTIVVNSLDPLYNEIMKETNDFCVLRDVHSALKNPQNRCIASGVMAWKKSKKHIFDKFEKDSEENMKKYRGDQECLSRLLLPEEKRNVKFFQDLLPNFIVSYKVSIRSKIISEDVLKHQVGVIVFHGFPKPWQQSEIKYGE
jgi:lipopolysaccharide biosynthesis glycosyltransferase